MKQIDGKWYIGLKFSTKEDAERFLEAVHGDDGEEVLAALREAEDYEEPFGSVVNSISGPTSGDTMQIGVCHGDIVNRSAGKKVRD